MRKVCFLDHCGSRPVRSLTVSYTALRDTTADHLPSGQTLAEKAALTSMLQPQTKQLRRLTEKRSQTSHTCNLDLRHSSLAISNPDAATLKADAENSFTTRMTLLPDETCPETRTAGHWGHHLKRSLPTGFSRFHAQTEQLSEMPVSYRRPTTHRS
jgi:hypothetical protein